MTTAAEGIGRVPRWWALPSCVLAVVVVGWEVQQDRPLRWAITGGLALLIIGLAATAGGYGLKIGRLELDRLLLWGLLGMFLVGQVVLGRAFAQDGNAMFLTGVLALLVGMELTRGLRGRLDEALQRLLDRRVVEVPTGRRARFETELDHQTRKWSRLGSIAIAAILLIAWIVVLLGPSGSRYSLWVVLFEVIGGWVAGDRIGRMVAYGSFWSTLTREGGAVVRVMPGHADGAGGLKPVGDFFLYQSLSASIPALYLAAWWWFIPVAGLDEWRSTYVGLLIVAIVVEVLAFLLPMRSIHATMRAQKRQFTAQADRLSSDIAELRARLRETKVPADRQSLKDEISDLSEDYQLILHSPTWPVDPSIRRRFGVSNLILMLPLVGEAIGGTFWQELADALSKVS